MNKIFKVVWSKVKHCYVVVSEVAKNVITGSIESAKIGGTPMTRGLALGVMMAFIITGNAWAEEDTETHNYYKLTSESFANALGGSGEFRVRETTGSNGYISLYTNYEIDSNNIVPPDNPKKPNKLELNEPLDITQNRNIFIYAGVKSDRAHFTHAKSTTSGNILSINNDLKVKNCLELYGGGVDQNNSGVDFVTFNLTKICGKQNDFIELVADKWYIVAVGGLANVGISDLGVNYVTNNSNTVEINYVEFYTDTVEISGGEVRENGDANSNTVKIEDVDFSEVSTIKIYGGQTKNGDAKDNSVTIKSINIDNTKIFGGYSGSGEVAGNILNIVGKIDGTADLVSNFGVINYDDLEWEASGFVIKTTSFELDDSNQVKVNVNGLSNGSTPKKGEVMTLLNTANSDLPDNYLKESESNFNSGSFLKAEGKIYQEDEDIKLKITRVGTNDQALVVGESRAAATAFANQGNELIEIGLDSLARDKSDKETKVFASVFGNTSEYTTGSHVKVNGWSGIVGVAKTNDDGLTTGAFFENGEGNYRTFNIFEGDFMRGDGEANYNGGGFFARKDNANGVYTEASLRAGNLQNELRKAVIADNKLEGYDIDTFYYGAHVGIGKIILRGSEGDSIDVYGKFIYTHHDSEDFAIGGDDFHFDSIDSERLRLGFRINEVQNDKLSMYYGAAWEYEFNGDANNTVIGCDISTPSLGGSTVIGEIGAHYKANEKWTFNANLRGYAGQRDGFTGSVQANYAF